MFSQVSVGSVDSKYVPYTDKHKKEDFESLRKTTSYFVVPTGMNFKKFKAVLKNIWTFNELKFITSEEFFKNQKEYVGIGKSIIRYSSNPITFDDYGYGSYSEFDQSFGGYLISKFVLYFCEKEKTNRKGQLERDMVNFSEIFFTPNIKLRHQVISNDPRYITSVFTAYASKVDKKTKKKSQGFITLI